MEEERYSAALILIAADPKGVTAVNMLLHYDCVDRGYPSSEQLYEVLNYLHAHGLVERKGKKFMQTEAGQRLCASEKGESSFETANAIAKRLVTLSPVDIRTEIISRKEAAFAVTCYSKLGCFIILWPFAILW